MERRNNFNIGLMFRDVENEKGLVGYAAVFYNPDDPGTEFGFYGIRERILPGAFDRAIREDDVRALFDHRSEMLLGRTASGTVSLSVDEKGLRYEIYDLPDTEVGRSVAEMVRRGDLTGSSFGFQIRDGGDEVRKDGEEWIREITDVVLFDVSPVTYPAYEATSVMQRSGALKDAMERVDLAKQMEAKVDDQKRLDLCRARVQSEILKLDI